MKRKLLSFGIVLMILTTVILGGIHPTAGDIAIDIDIPWSIPSGINI